MEKIKTKECFNYNNLLSSNNHSSQIGQLKSSFKKQINSEKPGIVESVSKNFEKMKSIPADFNYKTPKNFVLNLNNNKKSENCHYDNNLQENMTSYNFCNTQDNNKKDKNHSNSKNKNYAYSSTIYNGNSSLNPTVNKSSNNKLNNNNNFKNLNFKKFGIIGNTNKNLTTKDFKFPKGNNNSNNHYSNKDCKLSQKLTANKLSFRSNEKHEINIDGINLINKAKELVYGNKSNLIAKKNIKVYNPYKSKYKFIFIYNLIKNSDAKFNEKINKMTLLSSLKYLENSFSPKNKNYSLQCKISDKETYLKTENSAQDKYDRKDRSFLKYESCKYLFFKKGFVQ